MKAGSRTGAEHLLIFEPRVAGHHLAWLRFITQDLLGAGFELSLALDLRPDARAKIQEHLSDLLPELKMISVFESSGRRRGDGKAGSVALCKEESGADSVFLSCFDEIASNCLRRAACGAFPPVGLRGNMGGIYYRPKFMRANSWSPNQMLKQLGFRRLVRQGWFRQLLLIDEYLVQSSRAEWPKAPIYFLPDPCPRHVEGDSAAARRKLGVPLDKRVFLFYGSASRRKGLHLAVRAMLDLPGGAAFLLCAGEHRPDREVSRGLDQLAQSGRACLINRYITPAEEKLCFDSSDAVLLPYLNHFGTSGVLAQAMASHKMVIASDEQLLGQLVRDHGLGLLFTSGDVVELRQRICQVAEMPADELRKWGVAAKKYAERYSREAYRQALLASFCLPPVPAVAMGPGQPHV